MSTFTNVRIERPEGSIVFASVPVQIDTVMPDPKDDMGHDRDYVLFDCYFSYVPSVGVRRRDVLVDLLNIDPLTGSLARYRVT
jgi:hypothetical protein